MRLNIPRPITAASAALLTVALVFGSTGTNVHAQGFGSAFGLDSGASAGGEILPPMETAPSAVAPPSIGGMLNKLNPANWKMPSMKLPKLSTMMPGAGEKDRIIEKKDGLLSEVGRTASNSWNRTRDAINPMNMMPASSKSPTTPNAKKPGFFSRLFSPPAAADNSEMSDPNDFLSQKRIAP